MNMLLSSLLFYQLFEAVVVHAAYDAASITCVCSTTHCIEHQIFTCNTTGVCFSQYLDRKDGSPTEVKGCIASKTPLLCENRRPAVATASWPVLLCCDDENLCNRDVRPTPPFWILDESSKSDSGTLPRIGKGAQNQRASNEDVPAAPESQIDADSESTDAVDGDEHSTSRNRSRFPKIVSPVYISVLILGLISLVVIGIVAAVVLRRNNKFYAEQYGALERNEEYFKQPLNVAASLEDGDIDVGQHSVESCAHHHFHRPATIHGCCHVEISRT